MSVASKMIPAVREHPAGKPSAAHIGKGHSDLLIDLKIAVGTEGCPASHDLAFPFREAGLAITSQE